MKNNRILAAALSQPSACAEETKPPVKEVKPAKKKCRAKFDKAPGTYLKKLEGK